HIVKQGGGNAGQSKLQIPTSGHSKAPNSNFQHPEKLQTSIFNSVIHARQIWSFKDLKFLWSLDVGIWNFKVCSPGVYTLLRTAGTARRTGAKRFLSA